MGLEMSRIRKVLCSKANTAPPKKNDLGVNRFYQLFMGFVGSSHFLIVFLHPKASRTFLKEHSKILGVPIILVCTKIDRIEERKVSREEGIALAHSINLPYGVPYYETSSKENYNINESMAHLIEMAAKCKPCCSRQDKFLSWSMNLHSKCTDIQKQCLQLALLCNLRASENMILPNDIILHIFQFVPVAEHEIYWYEEGSDNYMQAYRNLLETQFGKDTEECNNSLIKLQKDYPKKSRKSCLIM